MKSKKALLFAVKLTISLVIMVLLARMIFSRDEAASLWQRLTEIRPGWVVVAVVMQIAAIACSIRRWQRLLLGQGVVAPLKHLVGTFMIGRFFGAFTPGGWTGLNGYRIYDIAKYTGKTAKAVATIGIEMLLGQLAFGVVVIIGSLAGVRYIGVYGVLLVDGFFIALMAAVIWTLAHPEFIRRIARVLPGVIAAKAQSVTEAVCAYQGKERLLSEAALLGVGTHTFNTLVFVASARALGVPLGPMDVFFVSAMQIFATLIPASINGIGLREATAVALYTRVGVPVGLSALIPMVGFVVEMAVSALGGIVLALRPVDYRPAISVNGEVESVHTDGVGRSDVATLVDDGALPNIVEASGIGFSAGLFAGALVGVIEACVTLGSASADLDFGIVWYGLVVYAMFFGVLATFMSATWAWFGRVTRRVAIPMRSAWPTLFATWASSVGLAIGAFRLRRDFFHEELKWKSLLGCGVLCALALVAALVAWSLYKVAFALIERSQKHDSSRVWWTSPLGSGAFVAVIGAALALGARGANTLASQQDPASAVAKPSQGAKGRPPVILIVVDTLRADHLPAYGYTKGHTPHLDAFVKDAVLFDHAFANSSWTRPSFATILSGRYAASHRAMAKMDALPDDLTTLAEAYVAAGYETGGIVTNYNVAPYFNFQQGFASYRYLEPDFVLGANDFAAKLLLVQFLRQKVETYRANRGSVAPGSAYQDAAHVNREVFRWLDQRGTLATKSGSPWFLFVGYMDPHDPYFPHPYDGTGYARAAHQTPALAEAAKLSALYDGEIAFWDDHFGKLVSKLKASGVYEEAIVMVTADHGEEFGEHGGFWHGTTLYDEQLHVPLIVKLPRGAQAGTARSQWVQLVDIAPTLLRLSNVEVASGMQGGDLFIGSDEAFAEESHEGNVLRALRSRVDGKAVKFIEANAGNPRGLATKEFFRLDEDPQEHRDLAFNAGEQVVAQSKRLVEYQTLAGKGASPRKNVDIANDATTLERLKALGYAN